MKYCPNCGLTYSDDTFEFCLQDGASLTDEPNSASQTPTISLNESNNIINELKRNKIEAENVNTWQTSPPIDDEPSEEPPQMSEIATLGNIFFEPGRTFEDLRRKPRFILALLISILLWTGFMIAFQTKVGDEAFKREFSRQNDKNEQLSQLPNDKKKQTVEIQLTVTKIISYAIGIFIIIFTVFGTLCYWLGSKAMGSQMGFLQALSVWVYAGFPVTVLSMLANFIVLYLKSADEIEIASSQGGLVRVGLGYFLDGKSMPVLTTLLNSFDLFSIWGWILAAIGLKIVGKLSGSSAWTLVVIFALLGIGYKLFQSYMSGNPL